MHSQQSSPPHFPGSKATVYTRVQPYEHGIPTTIPSHKLTCKNGLKMVIPFAKIKRCKGLSRLAAQPITGLSRKSQHTQQHTLASNKASKCKKCMGWLLFISKIKVFGL